MDKKPVGSIIKRYREEHDLSLRDFAEKSALSHAYVDKLEKGIDPRSKKNVEPTLDTLIKIASAMNISLDQLLEECGVLKNEVIEGLGDRIKKERLRLGLTQEELGKKCGVTKYTISLYESEKSTPNDEIKGIMADLFDCTIDYLLGRTDIKNAVIIDLNINGETARLHLEDDTYTFGDIIEITEDMINRNNPDKNLLEVILSVLKHKDPNEIVYQKKLHS
jgi:transcriptional regulator with XRE-family HTH domain